MTDCFGLFYISESKNRGFFFKIRELSVWVISETSKNQQISMKELAKNQQLEKLFFFENFKKIENQGSTPKPDFRFFFHPCWVSAYIPRL
jgi:hypothetical protein